MGTSTRATQPRSVPVQFTLSASNMYVAKSGKTHAARDRRKVLAAMAEAALRNDGLAGLEEEVDARIEDGITGRVGRKGVRTT